jgi:predicted transcriptional regulator
MNNLPTNTTMEQLTIRQYCTKHNLSIWELAKRTGISYSMLSKAQHKIDPSLQGRNIKKIYEVTKELYGESEALILIRFD